ncbi:MAG: hypothetical protein A49_01610 [Methyloceanibacter sp.]|nr:MAG: hypothetical protein A49_01610 [Methyloceanibacter sp.]
MSYPVGDPNIRPTDSADSLGQNGYQITQQFMNDYGHTGVDLANGASGGEVRAIGPGMVSLRLNAASSFGFGNVLVIRHDLPDGTFYSLYTHLQDGSVLVDQGDEILFSGQPIASVGNTGHSTGPHLHFAVKFVNTLGCGYIKPGHCASGDIFANYVDGGPLQFVADHQTAPCPPRFTDFFNRPDGAVVNGWTNIPSGAGHNLLVDNEKLTTPAPQGDDRAGIYRPINLTFPVSAWATFTHMNGFGGLLNRYDAGFLFGNDGTIVGGYGVFLGRGDQNYADSSVALVLNGVTLESQASSFQYGALINLFATLEVDGSMSGSVYGPEDSFDFSFGPRSVNVPGNNLALIQGFPDERSSVITNPTVDELNVEHACNTGPFPE